jgi:hypothetical protein
MLEIGQADAQMFIVSQQDPSGDVLDPNPSDCLDATLKQVSDRYPKFAAYRRNCLH